MNGFLLLLLLVVFFFIFVCLFVFAVCYSTKLQHENVQDKACYMCLGISRYMLVCPLLQEANEQSTPRSEMKTKSNFHCGHNSLVETKEVFYLSLIHI